MNENTASFLATIAYGLLALAGLLLAGLWLGEPGTAFCALLAAGTAYLSQSAYTAADPDGPLSRPGLYLQVVTCALFALGLLILL